MQIYNFCSEKQLIKLKKSVDSYAY